MKYLLIFFLSACTAVPYWIHDQAPLPAQVHILPTSDDVAFACGSLRVDGCADRYKDRCVIYIAEKDKDSCIMKHELRHCAGWTHPAGVHEAGC